MKTIKARAIVLREYEAGESDKRLLLLCKGHGKVMAYARGARKPSSKFMAAAQLFTYADFVLAQGSGFYALAQAEVIESFYPLRQDYDRLMTACLLVELCEKTLWDNIPCDELLLLILKSLSHLSRGKLPPEQITCVFLFRFFAFHGIQPQVDACIVCSTSVEEMESGIFLAAEGVVCSSHKPMGSLPISAAATHAMQYIQKNDLAKSFMFTVDKYTLKEMNQAAKLIIKSHFENLHHLS